MILKIKRLHEKSVIPSYAKEGDAGLDLTAVRIETQDGTQITYGIGLAFEIPQNHVGLIYPRSSIRKYDLQLSNSVGVIDSGYRGEIVFTFKKLKGISSKVYAVGDRVGQLIVMPIEQAQIRIVHELSESERGEGGFGSTGV